MFAFDLHIYVYVMSENELSLLLRVFSICLLYSHYLYESFTILKGVIFILHSCLTISNHI